MSKIKVYVRVRPPLKGEFDTPGCFNCTELEDVSGNWIRIKKEGEQTRYFARVWGPQSTQEEMFRTIGINTVNDVFEGYYGCIFVYGQTGTGKTFTLGCLTPGLEGIQPRCIKYLFDKIARESSKYQVTVKQQYVQLYREYVQDLLDISKDNLKIRMDENTGATIEKVTVRDVNTFEESIALIQEGDSSRVVANTKMNSASSRSHASLITEIWRKNRETGAETFGRLYLIDLAGSERASKSGVTDDAFKEMVAINQSLTTLGNCIAGLVNGEKVVSFRDSPLTRLLQHSLTGHGRTSVIVTIRPDSPNMQESICTLKFGERAQKVEAQMTPAGYRDNVVGAEEKLRTLVKQNAAHEEVTNYCKAWAKTLSEEEAERSRELQRLRDDTAAKLLQMEKAHEAKKLTYEAKWAEEEAAITAANHDELSRLKTENASVIKEIDDKVAEEVKRASEKHSAEVAAMDVMLSSANEQLNAAKRELAAAQEAMAAEDPILKAKRLVQQHRKTIEELQRKIRGCRKSAFEGLTMEELEAKLEVMRALRDHLEAKKEALDARMEDWDAKVIKKFLDKKYQAPDEAARMAYIDREMVAMRKTEGKDSESEPPPSDEAPPSSTEGDETSSDSDGDSSYEASTSDDDDDDDDGDSSDSSSESGDSDEDDDAEDGHAQAPPGGPNKAGPLSVEPRRPPCKKQLFAAIQKDAKLAEILEGIVTYLDGGTVVHVLRKHPPVTKDPNDFGKLVLSREFMYVGANRESIVLCQIQEGNPSKGNKLNTIETVMVVDIKNICLGQYSDNFQRALDLAPMIPQGTVVPPTSDKCSISSLRVFFRRSVSILSNATGESMLDIIFNSDADYEAWIVTFHRLTTKDPAWGGPMDVDVEEGVKQLTEAERTMCMNKHVPPKALLRTKKALMEVPRPPLYLTLYDFRAASGLDLIHAQRIFIFFIEEHYIERQSLYHIRYTEMMEEAKRREAERLALRALRIRLVNMVCFYKKADFAQIQNFLRASQGKEEALMARMIKDFGPEPTPEQLASLSVKVANVSAPPSRAVDEITKAMDAEKEPTKEQMEIMDDERKAREEAQRIAQAQQKLEMEVNAALASHDLEGPGNSANSSSGMNVASGVHSTSSSTNASMKVAPSRDSGKPKPGRCNSPPLSAPREGESHFDPGSI